MSTRRISRFTFNTLFLGTVVISTIFSLLSLHDYPQTKRMLQNYSEDQISGWIPLFYFLNEAGSGIRYAVTGNKVHMVNFPSEEYLGEEYREEFLDMMAKARHSGAWRAQMKLSNMYLQGAGVEHSLYRAAKWYALSILSLEEAEPEDRQQNKRDRIMIHYLNAELAHHITDVIWADAQSSIRHFKQHRQT